MGNIVCNHWKQQCMVLAQSIWNAVSPWGTRCGPTFLASESIAPDASGCHDQRGERARTKFPHFYREEEKRQIRPFRTTCSEMKRQTRLLTIYYARILFFILFRTAFRYADFVNFSILLSLFHILKSVVNVSKENAPVRSTWHLIWWIVLWSQRERYTSWSIGVEGDSPSKRRK